MSRIDGPWLRSVWCEMGGHAHEGEHTRVCPAFAVLGSRQEREEVPLSVTEKRQSAQNSCPFLFSWLPVPPERDARRQSHWDTDMCIAWMRETDTVG